MLRSEDALFQNAYPVQLLMVNPLGVQAKEVVVVAVYVVEVDVVVIQYIKNLPSLACSSLVPSTSEGLSSFSVLVTPEKSIAVSSPLTESTIRARLFLFPQAAAAVLDR